MTERKDERVDDRLRLDTGGEQSDSERRSQDGGSNGTTWGDITKGKRRNANRGAERGLRGAKGNVAGEEYHFAVIHVDETTPHLYCDFVPLTKRGIYR